MEKLCKDIINKIQDRLCVFDRLYGEIVDYLVGVDYLFYMV